MKHVRLSLALVLIAVPAGLIAWRAWQPDLEPVTFDYCRAYNMQMGELTPEQERVEKAWSATPNHDGYAGTSTAHSWCLNCSNGRREMCNAPPE